MGLREDALEALGVPKGPPKCNECGYEKNVEPDASVDCPDDDCDGKIKGKELQAGIV